MGRFFGFVLAFVYVDARTDCQITSIKNLEMPITDASLLLYKPLGLK
ncbi:hypothetical protein [Maribacter luteus]|nr:hypothetical protein [Maribacter luteus]